MEKMGKKTNEKGRGKHISFLTKVSLFAMAVIAGVMLQTGSVKAASVNNKSLHNADQILSSINKHGHIEDADIDVVRKVDENGTVRFSDAEIYAKMIAMKSVYPEGMRWTNDNGYSWNAGIFRTGYGCAGFAFHLSDAAFGTALPARVYVQPGGDTYKGPWKKDYNLIRVGDILRTNNDQHMVIVLEVHSTYIVVAEGNYNSSIHWGRIITRQALEAGELTYIMTRYPYDPDEHSHVYKETARTTDSVTLTCDCGATKVVYAPSAYTVFMQDANGKTYALTRAQESNIEIKKGTGENMVLLVDDKCNDNLIFINSNPNVASVRETKLTDEKYDKYFLITVTAKSAGTCGITVKSQYTNKVLGTLTIKVPCGDSEHVTAIKVTQKVEANCATVGKEYQVTYCKVCGKEFGGAWVSHGKNPSVHTGKVILKNAADATATEAGYTGDTYCVDCGAVLKKGTRIEPLSNPFADVSTLHWGYQYVSYAYQKQIMSGKGTDKNKKVIFRPDDAITRAEFVQTLYNLTKPTESISGSLKFKDVKSSDWYYKAILWANKKGIVAGKTETNFGANDQITRQEAATVLYNYVTKYLKKSDLKTQSLSSFTDYKTVDSWATKALQWATANKIINGKPAKNNKLMIAPKANTTRAETATIMKNFIDAMGLKK